MESRPGLVLIVEDDPDSLEVTAHAIRADGYDVATAPTGAEAVTLLRYGLRPAVIVLDLSMPTMDGFAFRAAMIEIDEALVAIPIVIYSAYSETAIKAAATVLRAAGFVRKPGIDRLLDLVSKAHLPSNA